MRTLAPALLLASTLALAATGASAQQAERLSRQDRTFAEHAWAGGMLEVQLGRMAERRATSQAARGFGARMVHDHSANLDQLAAVGRDVGVKRPSTLPASEQHQVDRLGALSGQQFDDAYMAQMVQDHQQDIKDYRKEIDLGHNSRLKTYAQDTLPMLQQHLAQAEDIARPQGATLPPTP